MTSSARTTPMTALLGALVVLSSTLWVASLEAQQPGAGREGCDLVSSRRLNSILTDDGERVTYISGPLAFQCEDGTRIRADSVVDFQTTRFRRLLGGVEIDGPEIRLEARRVHQSDDAGRLEAWDSVEVEQKGTETLLAGDSLVFLESGPARATSELTVMGDRPFAVLRLGGEPGSGPEAAGEAPEPARTGGDPAPGDAPRELEPPDTAGPAVRSVSPPDTVYADRLWMEGESRFVATGSVRVHRPDLEAHADSLDFGREENVAHLFGTPDAPARIDGEEFDLEARRVDLLLQDGDLSELLAVDRARLTGEDVEMEAPRIRIFMSDDEMDRLIAVRGTDEGASPDTGQGAAPSTDGSGAEGLQAGHPRPGRPQARARDFVLWADSIEVSAPGQELDQVFAVGDARGESLGRDSLNTPEMPELIRRDWIEGDTIVAHFLPTGGGVASEAEAAGAPTPAAPVPEAEEGSDPESAEYRLDRLVATGNARSLYRLAPRDTVAVVSVDEEGQAEEAEVTGAGGVGGGDAGGAARAGDGEPEDADDRTAGDSTATPPVESAPDARRRPAVHYVIGQGITIVLSDGDVERMEVEGQTRGIYLEPAVGRSGAPEASGDEEAEGAEDPGGAS